MPTKRSASKRLIGAVISVVILIIIISFLIMHGPSAVVSMFGNGVGGHANQGPAAGSGKPLPNTSSGTTDSSGTEGVPGGSTTQNGGLGAGLGSSNSPSQSGADRPTNMTEVEYIIHYSVNSIRNSYGLSQLNFDDRLAEIARNYSKEMANLSSVGDDILEGQDLSYRYDEAGYNCTVLYRTNPDGTKLYANGGENVAMTPLGNVTGCGYVHSEQQIADCLVNIMMDNHGYRTNIITSYWINEGVGIAVAADGSIYATENFC